MSVLSDEDRRGLCRLVAALSGAEHEFVIAGGQAARLYRFHPLARVLDWAPILTSDIDVATQDKGHRAIVNVGAQVEAQGFVATFEGDDRPPRTLYVLENAELEFIVPDVKRRHATGVTVDVLGVNAQRVPNLEPLLVAPVVLNIDGVGEVRLPNPAAYIVQKIITLTNRRTLAQKGKDALYVHDVLQLFMTATGLRRPIVEQAKEVTASLSRGQRLLLTENVTRLCDQQTDFVIEASRQASGRSVNSVAAITTALRLGFRELLPEFFTAR